MIVGLTPDITEAAVVRHGVLSLRFADRLSGEVEVLDRMRGPVFDRARTPDDFAEVSVDPETGTVVWPGGADRATDTLYERVRTGAWPDREASRPLGDEKPLVCRHIHLELALHALLAMQKVEGSRGKQAALRTERMVLSERKFVD